jgi:hypothetical protein
MDEPRTLPDEDVAALRNVAGRVVSTLTGAGLAAWLKDEPGTSVPGSGGASAAGSGGASAGGAEVWIETLVGTSSGVYVGWLQQPEVEDAVRDAVATANLTHPELPYAAKVLELMRQTIQAILVHAGFEVRDASQINGAQAFVPRVRPGSPS